MLAAAGIFGIHNHTASLVVELVLLALALLWLAMIYWTFADAHRRIESLPLIAGAVLMAFVPLLGTLIYMLVRPPEYLADVRERELEMKAAQARLTETGVKGCPYCDYLVSREFVRCPNCLRKLRERCVACGKPLEPEWRICPYCEADVGLDPALARRSRRTRRESGQSLAGRSPSDLI